MESRAERKFGLTRVLKVEERELGLMLGVSTGNGGRKKVNLRYILDIE